MLIKHKYRIYKNSVVYLLILSWITWVYASETTNCRCLHSSCSHKIEKLNSLQGFSASFKVFSKDFKSNNCCSHKTNNKNHSKNCNGTCECSITKSISSSKEVLITQNKISFNKDFFCALLLSSLPASNNITNQHDLSPPQNLLSYKIFILFSSLRI
jgi:hypothetical protein